MTNIIVIVSGIEFIIDISYWNKIKEYHLCVHKSRGKNYLTLYNKETKAGASAIKFLLDTTEKAVYVDKNTQNLSKDNLTTSTIQILNGTKVYKPKDKKKLAENARDYYRKNKKTISARNKKYAKQQTYIDNRHRKSRKLNSRYRNLGYSAKKKIRNGKPLEMSLTYEQYESLINRGCYYCSISLVNFTGGCLDRIDNSFGYSIDNVLPSCPECNILRMDQFTVGETKHMVLALKEYREKNMKGLCKNDE